MNSGGSAVNATLQCNGNVIINNGGLITNNGAFNMANSTTFTINNGGTYNHNPRVNDTANETMFNRTGATNTFGISSNLIMNGWSSGATPLGQYAPAFGNITFSAGGVWDQDGTFAPNKIKGNVSITSGQINFDDGTGATTALTINGTVTTSATGGVVFAQGANRNLTLVTGAFTHNGSSLAAGMYTTYGTFNWTVNGNMSVSRDFTAVQGTGSNVATTVVQINGNLNISGGLFDFNRAVNAPLTLTVTGDISITGTPGWVRFIDANSGALNVTCTNVTIAGGSANNFYYGLGAPAGTGTSNWTIANNIDISGTHTTNFSSGTGSLTMGIGNDINVSSTSTSWPYFMNNGTSAATTAVTVARDINITGAGLLRGAFSNGIVTINVNRNINMLSSSDFSGQRRTTSTSATNFNIGGNLVVNNATANVNGTLSNGNFNLSVTGNITLTNGTIYGIDGGDGNATITTTNFTQSAGTSRFINGGQGNVNFTASGDWNHGGGQHIGISYALNGNYGTVTYSMNNLNHTAGSIIYHSTDITDGRTCSIAIAGNATFNLAAGGDFCIINNITSFTTNNAVYNFTVGGNLTVSGASGVLGTRWTNTGPDNVFITGNMTLSGALTTFAGGLPASMPNNTLDCRIGGNVSITGSASFLTQSSNNTSKIDLNLGTASVTWAQTTSGTVSLTNTNIKTGKTLTLTGNKMGDLQTGRTATVETGAILWCSNFPVTGTGMFNLSSGAKIGSGSAAGLTSTGAPGNVQVTGTRTYNSNATYEYYEGLTPQSTGNFITTTTSATYPTQVTNLIINKTLPTNIVNLTNTTDMVNNGTLTLTSGVLTTSFTAATAPWIRIPNNSTTVSPVGGSANSYVKGYIRKTGNGAFIFPTGNAGKWRRIEANSLSASTEFEARYISSPYANVTTMSATPVTVLDHVSKIEHWMLNKPLGADAATAKVKLYWEDASMSGILKFDSLAVGRWNGTGWENTNCYVSCPGNWTSSTVQRTYTGSATGTGAGTIQSNTVSTFSPFTFASVGFAPLNPLPISLLTFDAKYNGKNVDLTWITTSEVNNDFFTVEKSYDLKNYETVGSVRGNGNSSITIKYDLIDNNPQGGITYYRLKQTDYDGNFEYFKPVSVFIKSVSDDFTIHPNPTKGVSAISFSSVYEGNQTVYIFDVTGRKIYEKQFEMVKGTNKVSLDTQVLSKGMYFIRLANRDDINVKLTKE